MTRRERQRYKRGWVYDDEAQAMASATRGRTGTPTAQLQPPTTQPQPANPQHGIPKSPPFDATGQSSGGGHHPLADGEGPSGQGEGGLAARAKATAEAMPSHPTQTQRM
eukprot:9154880-Karenia_brevis.AAC.1